MSRPDHTELAAVRARKLRNGLTISEARLWPHLKRAQTGARFRRQVPIGIWIVDFAALKPKIVVEVDDPSHEWRDEERRTSELERRGFVILRFTNREVAQEVERVVQIITEIVQELS